MNSSFEMEESSSKFSKNKKTVVVNKRLLIIIVVVVVILLVALPIITYYSRSCKVPSNSSNDIATTYNTTTTSTTSSTTNMLSYRLPSNLIPYKYEIKINAENISSSDLTPEYKGIVDIYFTCKEATNKLIFHIKNVEIDNSTLAIYSTNGNGFTSIKNPEWTNDFDREYFIIDSVFGLEFQKYQNYSIHIEYTGYLKTDNIGFYRSSYIKNEKTQWLLASQMSPTNARKAFPCFDEPGFKAKFQFEVTHSDSLEARSNMPGNEKFEKRNGLVTTKFDETPVMSTFIVGLLISDFECTEPRLANLATPLQVSACSRPDAINELKYALNMSTFIIEYLENFCDFPYPLPKLQHIAIPDFAAGAMENWGLIKYREARLLYDESKTSDSALQGIVSVMSHEQSHLWFGNLVSPQWWSNVWMKEGFARFFEYFATDVVKPDWGMRDQFQFHVSTIMQIDSVASSHRLIADISSSTEVTGLFDDISYGKGASIVRLLLYILGDLTFRTGLRAYLKKNQYNSVNQDDLWNILADTAGEELSSINFSEVMNTWTKQMGHPVVFVNTTSKTNITLTQQQFLLNPNVKPNEISDYDYKWFVPFTYSVETISERNNEIFDANETNIYKKISWFKPMEQSKTISLKSPLDNKMFVIANLDSFGYYRVNYDQDNWSKIKNQLSFNYELIPTKNRAQILNDVFGFSQAFLITPPTTPFEIAKYLSNETEYLPWTIAFDRLKYITDQLQFRLAYQDLKKYYLSLIEPIYNKLGWNVREQDRWLDRLLRVSVLNFACENDLEYCVKNATDMFKDWKNTNSNMIPASLRSFVYCTSIRNGGSDEWNFLSKNYDLESDSNARNDLQYGMSCSKEPFLIKAFLNDQINSTKVRTQDTLTGVRYAARSPYATEFTWNFVKNNWIVLFNRYGNTLSFGRLFTDLTSKFNTQNQLDDFNSFANLNPNQGSAAAEVKISKDKILANISWLKENYDSISKWLSENFATV